MPVKKLFNYRDESPTVAQGKTWFHDWLVVKSYTVYRGVDRLFAKNKCRSFVIRIECKFSCHGDHRYTQLHITDQTINSSQPG